MEQTIHVGDCVAHSPADIQRCRHATFTSECDETEIAFGQEREFVLDPVEVAEYTLDVRAHEVVNVVIHTAVRSIVVNFHGAPE